MPVLDSKFSNFADGGDLEVDDIVVGLRNGLNTRFSFQGTPGLYLPLAGGTMAGAIDMDGNEIFGLPAPVGNSDATNKLYVDTAISTAVGSYLPLAGGIMSGAIAMGTFKITGMGNPTLAQDAATKFYVDAQVAAASPLTTKGDLWSYSTVNARLAVGSTNGQVLQVASGAATGLAYSTATYPTVATGTGTLLRANGTNWVPSTSTFADTYLINTIPFAGSANTLAGATLTSIIDTAIGSTQGNILYRNASAWVVLAPGTSGQFLQTLGAAANVQWAPGDGAGTVTSISAGTGITLTPDPITSSGTVALTSPVALTNGGTNASLVASNGGIFYSTATAGAILSGTATARQMLQSGASGAPAWSTTTYPATNAINTMMYASAANVLSVIAAGNSSVLVTSAGGVPSFSTTLPSGLTIPGYAASGANSDITSMTGLTGYLQAPLGIKDANGNEILIFSSVASAINELTITNAATGTNPMITATGGNTDISINFQMKGSGAYQFFGTSSVPANINLLEDTDNGSNYIGLKAPSAVASNLVFELPGLDGSANDSIVTNGGAILSFSPRFGKTVTQIFTAGGTYTPTSGMKYCIIECMGGGGAGGGAAAAGVGAGTSGGGGGGGSYAAIVASAATIGANQTVTIGAGGTAGTAGNNAGNNGGDTSVGSICIGKGGTGGGGSAGTPGGTGGAGGVAGTGTVTFVGGNGSYGQYGGIVTVMAISGVGGKSFWGAGAPSQSSNSAFTGPAGSLGGGYGGGGGGGTSYNNSGTTAGGAGMAGYVRITEFIGTA